MLGWRFVDWMGVGWLGCLCILPVEVLHVGCVAWVDVD